MTNKDTRVRSDKKPRLRLLDLTFDKTGQKNEYNLYGSRPHGGLKGSKKHPLSPYSYNKPAEYHKQITDDLGKLFHEEFIDGKGSPAWTYGVSKEITHSGESPFFIHGLLSSSRVESESVTPVQSHRRSTTPLSTSRQSPKHSEPSYYRPTTPHSYLKSPDPQNLSQNDIKYGRPTRTTLLRARQRCASAPVNKYEMRREIIRTSVDPTKSSQNVKEIDNPPPSSQSSRETISMPSGSESSHAFLTGARYNRAHFLDAKSLSVYGVYMPRTNPHGLFMTGHAVHRSKDRGQNIPSAPPDSPRSDVDEVSKPEKRPVTAPGKRLLSSSMHGRPRSAWGESTSTTCQIVHGDNERTQVVVTFKSSKQLKPNTESVLPSVTGRTAPTMYYRRPREAIEDLTSVNQPPPTPVGGYSARDGSERVYSYRSGHIPVNSAKTIPNELQEETKLNHSANDDKDDDYDDDMIDGKMVDGREHGENKTDIDGNDTNTVDKNTEIKSGNENGPVAQDIVVVGVTDPDKENQSEIIKTGNEGENDLVKTGTESELPKDSNDKPLVENGQSEVSKDIFFITKEKEDEAPNAVCNGDKTEEEENPTSIHVTITEKVQEKSS